MLASNTVLQSRYMVVKQLGEGGMGAVYEAVDQRLDTIVALKETFFSEERLRKQFEREARLLARLHHPALPRVSDHFTEGDGQFLVMQFIPGEDLSEMLKRNGGMFPPEEVIGWADQLLDALDYLHTQEPQIIHRDIKPQNLKLTSRGQIILLDFGLAKGYANQLSHVTAASIFGYTPNYAPLEQIQGHGTDPRSDLYSLAATLYHLMTGVKPPDALTRAAALVNGQTDPLRPANEVNPRVKPEIAAWLKRAMAQSRDQRFASAAEMRNALRTAAQPPAQPDRSEVETVVLPKKAVSSPADVSRTQKQAAITNRSVVPTPSTHSHVKRHLNPWWVAAPLILLLLGGLGIFYALQRQAGPGLPAPQIASPANDQGNATVPAAPGSSAPSVNNGAENANSIADANDKRRAESNGNTNRQRAITNQPREESAQKSPTPEPRRSTAENRPDSANNSVQNASQQDISGGVNDTHADITDTHIERGGGQFGGNPARPNRPPVVRFRNGNMIVAYPDGTRIVTSPDGTKHVFRPGERIPWRGLAP